MGSGRTDWIWRIFAYVPFLCRTKSAVCATVTPKSFESGQKFAQGFAHNNCLLNALSRTSTTRPSPEISAFIASLDNISAGERRSKLTSRPMFEIVCLLYAYNKMVSPSVKKRRIKQLTEFVNGRMQRHIDYFEGPEGNKLIATSFEFLKKVVDKLN